MGRVLVILPTYNECDNLKAVAEEILEVLPASDLWIVDDNSPDGTGEIADTIAAGHDRVRVFHRPYKAGLGSAYAESFRLALDEGYDFVVEMDADFSHDPKILPELLREAERADLVLGSRYVPGGSTPDWSFRRRLISQVGNVVARVVLGLPVHDATTGYRVFTRGTLGQMHLAGLHLQGYGFQIETVYQCHQDGLRIQEYPIRFLDRQLGRSKMSRAIVIEALFYVFRRRFTDLYRRLSRREQPPDVRNDDHQSEYTDRTHDHVKPAAPVKTEIPIDQLE
jgi:dolichol-phosphate mannosyltransferase